MAEPFVSIIIPAYNSERWIRATLESALAQTWPHTEVIVINDGSTDLTEKILSTYEARGVRVKSQVNQGPCSARNAGIRMARGDYFQFLDHDDLLSASKIEDQILIARRSPPGALILSRGITFLDGTDPLKGHLNLDWPVEDSEKPLDWLIQLYGPDGPAKMVHPSGWLVPRALVEKAGGWNETLEYNPVDDAEFFVRMVSACTVIRKSGPAVTYVRRYKKNQHISLSSATAPQYIWTRLYAYDAITKILLEKCGDDSRSKKAMANRFKETAYICYPVSKEAAAYALKRVQALGGTDYEPWSRSWRWRFLSKTLGWRIARVLSCYYHRLF